MNIFYKNLGNKNIKYYCCLSILFVTLVVVLGLIFVDCYLKRIIPLDQSRLDRISRVITCLIT